ncbi:restriction endonuclease subunit S [Pacificibacter sp.]|uniref:restriction endonuclease subunit S n=1 Tax=Pacificibacter sp. TaxID=1917866 RepID=UPI00321BC5A5
MTATIEKASVLPRGWSLVRLADVGSFLSGSGFPLVYQGNTSGNLPFFKVSDFSNPGNERTLNRANHYIAEETRRKLGARLLPEGAIAFAKIGAAIFLERKRIIDQSSCLDNNMAAFVLSAPEISRDLILAHFQSFALGGLVSSTALPAISSTDLKSIEFPLPDDPKEQQAIAEALSDADGLIEGLERLIAKKRLIKQGAMQDLLTAKRRLPGFSGEWVSKPLFDICRFSSGKAHEPYIDPLGNFICVNSKFISTDGDVAKFCSKCVSPARKDDILLVMSDLPNGRALAKAFLVQENDRYAVNQRICILRPNIEQDPRFLFHILNRNKYFLAFDDGVNQTHLLNSVFERCTLNMPATLQEQVEIGTILSDMDAEIQALETRLVKARQVKEGMMQNLLTGRIRLV